MWGKGIVYVREMKGLGREHKKNVIYYVNKDIMKPTGLKHIKKRKHKWGFGKNYEFEEKPMFSVSKMVTYNQCKSKMLTTRDKFMKYYDSFGENGYNLLYRKMRYMDSGLYDKVIY